MMLEYMFTICYPQSIYIILLSELLTVLVSSCHNSIRNKSLEKLVQFVNHY